MTSTSKTGILAEPVLVGRQNELEQLDSFLNSALNGNGETLFISGEAGTGKTRLINEFLRKAKELQVDILQGWCLSNAAVPYFPFFEAFKAYFTTILPKEFEGAGDVTEWLKGYSQGSNSRKLISSPQIWKDQTFAAVANTLTSISAKKTVILFIDDLQWADSASLSLIHYIARAIKSERVLLIATYRSEDLTPSVDVGPHPLVETLRLMRREELFKEIKLTSLSHADVSELVTSMLGGDVQQAFITKLAEESQGNALFIIESVRMLHERNELIHEYEKWRPSSEKLEIPNKIKDIILQRLSVLPHSQRRILEAASVIGEKFDVELLASVLDQQYLETADELDVIGRTTSLVCSEGELYRFDHARSRKAIYDEVSPTLKRAYHGMVAEKIEKASNKGKPPLSELAHHYNQAGNQDKAIKYALAAGQEALATWSNVEAARYFDDVLKAIAGEPQRTEERLSAMEGLGDAFFANSMFKEAARMFENLASIAKNGAGKLRALRKAMTSIMHFGDSTHLRELFEKARLSDAVDRLESARILMYTPTAFPRRSLEAGLEDRLAALKVFEEEYSFSDIASALFIIGGIKARLGNSKEGLAASLRSISMFEELGDFRSQLAAIFFAGLAFNNCLLSQEGFEMLARITEIAEKKKINDYLRLSESNAFMTSSLANTGKFEKALPHGIKALELSKKTDSILTRGIAYSRLIIIYTRLGEIEHAEDCFNELMKLPAEIRDNVFVHGANSIAVFYAGTNQWEKSNKQFEEFFKMLGRNPSPAGLTAAKLSYAWALERQGRFEEARIQLEESKRIRRRAEAKFEHADLRAYLMVRRQVAVNEEFEMRIDFVNVARKPAQLVGIRNVLFDDFKIIASPLWCSTKGESIDLGSMEIGPFQVETAKFTAKILTSGTFSLNPQVVYVDDLGEEVTFNISPVTIISSQAAEPEGTLGKIPSGTSELDSLLLGGIPRNYSMLLTSSAIEESENLIQNFLVEGAKAGEITFYITSDPIRGKALTEKHQSGFYLLVCHPQAETFIQSLPNVFALKGIESLTEIDIALVKAFHAMGKSAPEPKRIGITVLSDMLLQHRALNTRRWISALLPMLKIKGFTVLATVDPGMHTPEEIQTILTLFDGEIRITEKDSEKVLKIVRANNQKYRDNELVLKRKTY